MKRRHARQAPAESARAATEMTVWRIAMVALCLLVLGGCGGSGSSSPSGPVIPAARTFELAHFEPSGPVAPDRSASVSFVIRQPNGKPLTSFRRGSGPHTGVHVILVRRDLAYIVHRHPPIAPDGTIHDRFALPAAGPYRVVVDVYPSTIGPQRNFQLFHTVDVRGSYAPRKLPVLARTQTVDGYRFVLEQAPRLTALEPAFLAIRVTAPDGRPARFTPWYGALAHAIFFRRGSLDYFHTHVCAPGASGCTSALGAATVTGKSAEPGKLTVGVLVPTPGEWRLFLQCKATGQVLTAPFTLRVR